MAILLLGILMVVVGTYVGTVATSGLEHWVGAVICFLGGWLACKAYTSKEHMQ